MKQGMIRFVLCAAVLFAIPHSSMAGQVYGTIAGAAGPLSGRTVTIKCGNAAPSSGNTDRYGSYSLFVRKTGRCEISVDGFEPLTIRVYNDPVRYDLRAEDNRLQRK